MLRNFQQGIAQCYERPLWRAAGDVDLLLDASVYDRAKALLIPLASSVDKEGVGTLHLGMKIDGWEVELHGSQRAGLDSQMDRVIDEVQRDMFKQDRFRFWQNEGTEVPLSAPDDDIIFVFTHFLKHFYKGGLGLRQICDWIRLLWTYRDSLDCALLASRLRRMGLVTEWKAFAAFAVCVLGMPAEAMPLYDSSPRWGRKARRIQAFVMDVGNFGHNRDMSYYRKYPYLVRKTISAAQRLSDLCRHARIFPLDSLRFMPGIVFNGLRSAARGE